MSTTLELLQGATLLLCQGGAIKDRFAQAYVSHLAFVDVAQVPEPLRGEYRALCEALRRERPLPDENPGRASIRKMSNEEVARHATLVVRLYGAVARHGAAAVPAPAAAQRPALAPVVPRRASRA